MYDTKDRCERVIRNLKKIIENKKSGGFPYAEAEKRLKEVEDNLKNLLN